MKEENRQERSIRFITSDYTDLFRIQDGGTILVTFPDRQFIERCEYIDDYHFKAGNSVYHICQYAEILEQNGGQCEPEPETVSDRVAWQVGRGEYLMIERTESGFRYELLTKEFLSRTQGQLDDPSWTMNHAREYILELVGIFRQSRIAVPFDIVKQRSREVLKASDLTMIEWTESRYYPGIRTSEHNLTCKIRGKTACLRYEVSQHDDGEGFVINSDGDDIWDIMPEPELRKLEPVLARAVEYGHWKRDIAEAKTVEAVRDVRFSLGESEHLIMTREQIGKLHEAMDHKEGMLTAVRRAGGSEEKAAGKVLKAKDLHQNEGIGNLKMEKAMVPETQCLCKKRSDSVCRLQSDGTVSHIRVPDGL